MRIARRGLVGAVVLVAFALLPAVSAVFGQDFYVDLATRIMIFAIAAVSLDFVLGYGGMVSFGHAAFLGVGSYAVGILAFYQIDNGFLQFAVAIGASALLALLIGWVSLRTAGVYFIMITLAFGQMVYFLGESINQYGGDNGLNIAQPSNFGGLIDLGDPTTLYYFVFAWLVVAVLGGWRLAASRFGMVLQGAKANEERMRALGFPTFRYKLAAFVVSGAMAGVAGALLANQTLFLAPAIMHWTRSGEIMMMVILGGMGTLIGPVVGAVIYLVFENVFSGVTAHWQAIFGPLLVLAVLLSRGGLLAAILGRGADAAERESGA